jgi:CBS domain-containing protein
MKVSELMWKPVESIEPDALVGEAVRIMAESHVSGLPVMDGRSRLLGVISATDVLRAASEASDGSAREQLFAETSVRELMSPQPLTIGPDAEVREAAQQMLYFDIHRLFVERKGQVVGVISQSDIARGVATAKI